MHTMLLCGGSLIAQQTAWHRKTPHQSHVTFISDSKWSTSVDFIHFVRHFLSEPYLVDQCFANKDYSLDPRLPLLRRTRMIIRKIKMADSRTAIELPNINNVIDVKFVSSTDPETTPHTNITLMTMFLSVSFWLVDNMTSLVMFQSLVKLFVSTHVMQRVAGECDTSVGV